MVADEEATPTCFYLGCPGTVRWTLLVGGMNAPKMLIGACDPHREDAEKSFGVAATCLDEEWEPVEVPDTVHVNISSDGEPTHAVCTICGDEWDSRKDPPPPPIEVWAADHGCTPPP